MVKKKTCQVEQRKPHQIPADHRGRKEDLLEKAAFGLGIVQKSMAGRDGERMIITMGHAYELLGTT